MPDAAVGFQEMYQYGYTDGDTMLPLTKERAMELFMPRSRRCAPETSASVKRWTSTWTWRGCG